MRFAESSSIPEDAPAEADMRAFSAATPAAQSEPAPESDGVDLSFLDAPMEDGELGRIAHYRVLSILGVGGMGVVLRGEDTHLRRPVALKVMRKEYVESYASRERFLQEARVAAAVESENIVTIYQVGMHNDVPYLAMQFLHGEALDERLNRQAPLPVPFALLIARQTAAGLADAHANGLVHRDIKPANIWLETDPATQKFRRVRLLDFGLARIIASNQKLTSMGVIVGTPQYMSPEQAFGSDVDGRADLFSLGAVMYAMFTGKLPFEGPNSAAVLMSLVSQNPPRAITVNRLVPPEVDDLIDRLLAKEPEKRPQSADEVVELLDSVLIEFSAPVLGRTSGVLGYPVRTDTFPGTRTTPPPAGGMGREVRGKTIIGPQPTISLAAPVPPPKAEVPLEPTVEHIVMTAVAPPPPPAIPSPPAPHPLPAGHSHSAPHRSHHLWANVVGWGLLLTLTTLMTFGIIGPKTPPAPGIPVPPPAPQELRVGVLYAKSGSMAALEQSMADATMLAIDELNQRGGVLGKKIVPVELDAGQTMEESARQAEVLVKDRGVTTIFGCPTPASRRNVRPLVERFNGVLFCPGPHEGMEECTRIVYVGSPLAQSLSPSVLQRLTKESRTVFVVGQDDVFSRVAGALVHDALAKDSGVKLVGEAYVPTTTKQFEPVIEQIRTANPDLIVSGFQGGSAVLFVQQLRSASPAVKARVLHLKHIEDFHRTVDPAMMRGDFLSSGYIASEPASKAEGFAARFQARYGANREVTDSMADAYSAVMLWARAVEFAGSDLPDQVLTALPNLQPEGPLTGIVADATGRHFRFPSLLAEFQDDGSLAVIHRENAKETLIYPPSRTPADWDRYLRQLYIRWGARGSGN